MTASNDVESFFPNLVSSGYKITSPKTVNYNCIAWAAEDDTRWWWPDAFGIYFWPESLPREETMEVFQKAFEGLGYSVCENPVFETGAQKIAIYGKASPPKPSHAARQVQNGNWTSKLGKLVDIEHRTLDGLNGSHYGAVALVLRRPTTPTLSQRA